MALFSQDDSDDPEAPSTGVMFRGGDEPDAETETPSPVEVDGGSKASKVVAVDDAHTYAKSPDEQGSMLDNPRSEDYPFPLQQDDEAAGQYAEPSQSEPEHHWESVPAPERGGSVEGPAQPQFADNAANYQELERQIGSFNPNDYKPSIGRRIAAALSGGAVAFGSRNPALGVQVAEGVNSAPLDRARMIEQQRESATRQRIQDVEAQNQRERQAGNDAALNEQRSEHAQDFKAQAEQRARAQANTKPGKTGLTPDRQAVFDEAGAEADKLGLTGQERTFYIAEAVNHGRLPAAFARQGSTSGSGSPRNGRTPQTPQGIQQLIAKNIQDKETFQAQWKRQPDGTYQNPTTGAILDGPAFDAKVEQFRTSLNANPNMRKAGTWVDATGVTRGPGEQGVERAQGPQSAPAAQPAPQSAPAPQRAAAPPPPQGPPFQYKGQTFHAGQTVNIDGKPAVVKGINPQTGKLIVGAQ